MGSRGAVATLALHLMVVATLALAAATFMSTAEAACSHSMAQNFKVSSRSGRFRHSEGGEDGLYMASVEVDEQGVEQYRVKFLGKGNTTLDGRWGANSNVSRAARGGLGRKLLQDTGTHCEGSLLVPSEVFDAVTSLANLFGYDGNTMPPRGIIWEASGCAVAYICNYNYARLFTTSAQITLDHYSLDESCTIYGGGWYNHETSNSRNGRTYVMNNFC